MNSLQPHIQNIQRQGTFYDKQGVQYGRNDKLAMFLKKVENFVLCIFPSLGKFFRFGDHEVRQAIVEAFKGRDVTQLNLNDDDWGWMGTYGDALATLKVTHKLDLLAQHARAARNKRVAFGRTEEEMFRLWGNYASNWSDAITVLKEYENNPNIVIDFLELAINQRINPPKIEPKPSPGDTELVETASLNERDEFGVEAINELFEELEAINLGDRVVFQGDAVSPQYAENRRRDFEWVHRGD